QAKLRRANDRALFCLDACETLYLTFHFRHICSLIILAKLVASLSPAEVRDSACQRAHQDGARDILQARSVANAAARRRLLLSDHDRSASLQVDHVLACIQLDWAAASLTIPQWCELLLCTQP